MGDNLPPVGNGELSGKKRGGTKINREHDMIKRLPPGQFESVCGPGNQYRVHILISHEPTLVYIRERFLYVVIFLLMIVHDRRTGQHYRLCDHSQFTLDRIWGQYIAGP